MTTTNRLTISKVTPAYWRVIIENPPINLYDPEMFAELNVLMDRIEADTGLKVVVFESANPDYFVAHYDLERGEVIPEQPRAAEFSAWPKFVTRLAQSRVVSVAKLRGRARGHGSEPALACDIKGDYEGWKHVNPTQVRPNQAQAFAAGIWGGEFHPEFGPRAGDVVVLEHWGQSCFANTDLDAQLKQRGIQRIILVGMIANTCNEGTARFGMELGHHVTLVKDATAAFSHEGMHAAHEVNGPSYAHAILTSEQLLALLPQTSTPHLKGEEHE